MAQEQRSELFHYAWVIVFAGALTLFACLGLARFAFGMLLPSMREGLGLAYDQMGLVSTCNFAGYLVAVALAPLVIRRFRPRGTIAVSLLAIALCMFGIGRSETLGEVLCLYTLVGLGSGLANIPAMVLVSHWFRRQRRGRAAGLMIVGNGSAIIFAGFLVPLLGRTLGEGSWRTAWMIMGLITLLIAAVAARLLRNDPADIGAEPLGGRGAVEEKELIPQPERSAGRILIQLGLLYLLFGATYMVYGTFIVTTMVEEYGFSQGRAGMFWSWVGFFSIFSGVLFGSLSDRIGRRGGLAAVFSLQTLAYLMAGSQAGSAALLISFVLYGLSVFAVPTIMAAAVGDYLGLPRAAAGFSIVTFFFSAGQTVGPGSAGLIAEATGTFTSSYLLCAALTAAAVLLTVLLPKREAS